MKKSTQDAFAAILAAAQQKADQKATPKFKSQEQPKKQPEKKKDSTPELSTTTTDDLLNDQPKAQQYTMVDYSDRSFAIPTPEKPSEEVLTVFRKYGGYNRNLKKNIGKGWIFSKRHYDEVKQALHL